MTVSEILGSRPYSLAEIIDLFLADLERVETTELAGQIDNPFLGRLIELVLERRRAARLTNQAEHAQPGAKNTLH